MRAGHPLDDDDRAPWLAAIGAWIDTQLQRREPGVVVCSALRRAYRDALVRGRAAVRIVYLEGDRALIDRRLARAARALHAGGPPRHPVRHPGAAGAGGERGRGRASRPPPRPSPQRSRPGLGLGEGAQPQTLRPHTRSPCPCPSRTDPRRIALVISDVDGTLVDHRQAPDAGDPRGGARGWRRRASPSPSRRAGRPWACKSLVAELGLTPADGGLQRQHPGRAPTSPSCRRRLIPAAGRPRGRRGASPRPARHLGVRPRAAGTSPTRTAPYTDLERRTLQAEPNVVADLGPLLDQAAKIVGVSADAAHLAACEARDRRRLGGTGRRPPLAGLLPRRDAARLRQGRLRRRHEPAPRDRPMPGSPPSATPPTTCRCSPAADSRWRWATPRRRCRPRRGPSRPRTTRTASQKPSTNSFCGAEASLCPRRPHGTARPLATLANRFRHNPDSGCGDCAMCATAHGETATLDPPEPLSGRNSPGP